MTIIIIMIMFAAIQVVLRTRGKRQKDLKRRRTWIRTRNLNCLLSSFYYSAFLKVKVRFFHRQEFLIYSYLSLLFLLFFTSLFSITSSYIWGFHTSVCSILQVPLHCTPLFVLSFLVAVADLKISLYVCVHMKTILWKFRFLNVENSRVICPWNV